MAVDFLVFAIPLSLSVWVLQRQTWRWPIRFVILGGLLAILGFGLYVHSGPATLGPATQWHEKSPGREAILFTVMLLGMAARYVTKAIEFRRERIVELQRHGEQFETPGLEFDLWEFSYPLFLSVVTFGAIMSQMTESTLTAANVILSFQSGFFWQTILASRQSGVDRSPTT